MIYKSFKGLQLSRLGIGNMRLPTVARQGEKIDEAAARAIIEAAYEAGINYFDTAYRFTGMLAAFPARSPAELFEEQLEKCKVDYFDFYLLHNVCENAWDFYTDEKVGVVDYLLEQKKAGHSQADCYL